MVFALEGGFYYTFRKIELRMFYCQINLKY